jgi:hypothetical protein
MLPRLQLLGFTLHHAAIDAALAAALPTATALRVRVPLSHLRCCHVVA